MPNALMPGYATAPYAGNNVGGGYPPPMSNAQMGGGYQTQPYQPMPQMGGYPSQNALMGPSAGRSPYQLMGGGGGGYGLPQTPQIPGVPQGMINPAAGGLRGMVDPLGVSQGMGGVRSALDPLGIFGSRGPGPQFSSMPAYQAASGYYGRYR